MKIRIVRRRRMVKRTVLVLLLVAVTGAGCWGSGPSRDVLTEHLSEPLNGVTTATVDIDAGDGNLTIDSLTGGEQVLAAGTLQYLEKQGQPDRQYVSFNGEADLALSARHGAEPRLRLPWAACGGATEWHIHLNPTVASDITAHSDGGNVRLDLSGTAVTRVSADASRGNVDVVLPDTAAKLDVTAKSGAGNVTVLVPDGVAVRVHASTRLGRLDLDPRFVQVDDTTYQSPDFDSAAHTIEITAESGAGKVVVATQ